MQPIKNHILTATKRWVNPLNLQNEDISIKDIAHSLSMQCRANGHFPIFYSVAQHCINCALEAKARGLSKKIQLFCLLHDASEAYIADVPRPVKHKLQSYNEIENIVSGVIFNAFGLHDLTEEELKAVEEIDDAMLYHEFYALMGVQLFKDVPHVAMEHDFSEKTRKDVMRSFLELFHANGSISGGEKVIGVDGCRGGWAAFIIQGNDYAFNVYPSILKLCSDHPDANVILIDMPIGLQNDKDQKRPDADARKMIRKRTSTIFPAPCRQAVYAKTVAESYLENERVLGKRFTPLTCGIIPKMREVDEFLQKHSDFKQRLVESHPEVCFAVLNHDKTLLTKKTHWDGQRERMEILNRFQNEITLSDICQLTDMHHCAADDIIDALCMAVVAGYVKSGRFKTIPAQPQEDDTGLKMQMLIPDIN